MEVYYQQKNKKNNHRHSQKTRFYNLSSEVQILQVLKKNRRKTDQNHGKKLKDCNLMNCHKHNKWRISKEYRSQQAKQGNWAT